MCTRFAIRFRFLFQAGFDVLCWFVALAVAATLRFEFVTSRVSFSAVAVVGLIAAVLQVGTGRLLGLYIHRWRYGVLEEVYALAKSVVLVTVAITLTDQLLLGHHLPTSATLMGGCLGFLFMTGGRFVWRLNLDRWSRPDDKAAERVIVFGAGDGGNQVIRAMFGKHDQPYFPVALLDDNTDLRNLQIKGVPVRGGRDALEEVAARSRATTLVIAIPSASSDLIRDLVARADRIGLRTLVLPRVSDLFGSAIGVADIRPLSEADLLGRREIQTNIESVAHYITGKRVMVTGAGGSIGSELCRQLHRFAPESLIMLDRDESALQAVQLSIEGRSLLDSEELVVCCIRDRDRLAEIFDRHRPEVVFHAAALKHLSLLEMHPEEGHKTNVVGTQNLLELAGLHDVEVFVNISTDKAADPSSVLGRTKRLAECLTSWAADHSSGRYISVRFGNVLGSRGSVLPLFRAQIELGGPVTVTDPDVTRFFMTIEEACQLVVQAGAMDRSGEVMVLDMGEPVRIADLAKRLIAESSRRVEIVYTGLRPGEKMNEALFGENEVPIASEHPLISCVAVPAVDPVIIRASEGNAMVIDLRPSGRPVSAPATGAEESA